MVFGLFGGKDVAISIELDRANGSYAPGDNVGVSIALRADGSATMRAVRAGLLLAHSYKQTVRNRNRRSSESEYADQWRTDETWFHRAELVGEQSLPANFQQSYHFDWPLPPDLPPVCETGLFKIRYLVKVTVDHKMARDINEEVVLPVRVPPPGRYAEPGEFGTMNSADAQMRLALQKLEFSQGETIAGKLLIEPSDEFEARAVRVELVRHEHVGAGDRPNDYRHTEQKLELASKTPLLPGAPLSYDFALTVPAAAWPSHQTPQSSHTWSVRGVLDRQLKGDVVVSQDVNIYDKTAGTVEQVPGQAMGSEEAR